jgi:hypothetical protein
MKDMLPGNSFPRSALFLLFSLRAKPIKHNGTEGLWLFVTRAELLTYSILIFLTTVLQLL